MREETQFYLVIGLLDKSVQFENFQKNYLSLHDSLAPLHYSSIWIFSFKNRFYRKNKEELLEFKNLQQIKGKYEHID